MVKVIVQTNIGLEEACKNEIERIVDINDVEIYEEVIIFEVESMDSLAKIIMHSQCANRVCLYQSTIEDLKLDHSYIENKTLAIKLKCKEGKYEKEDRKNKEREYASNICDYLRTNDVPYTVDLKKPHIMYLCFETEEETFVGIDFSGELNKREYLVFAHNQALKSTLAASMVELSGFDGEGVFLDPFCGGGTIPVECALKFNKGLHYYDFDDLTIHKYMDLEFEKPKLELNGKIFGYDILLNTVNAARKNAKIAGILKKVEISKYDIEMLDIKFDEKSVDYIVTHPPIYTNRDEKKVMKAWENFLLFTEDVLTKRMVVCLHNKVDEFIEMSEDFDLELINRIDTMQGKSPMTMLVYEPCEGEDSPEDEE